MLSRIIRSVTVCIGCAGLALSVSGAIGAAIIADHSAVSEFELVPETAIEDVKAEYRLFYGHTSHGSQIVTGMEMLRSENILFDFGNGPGQLYLEEIGGDLGHRGDTQWAETTRQRLNQPQSDINVVIWSWCGGCADNTEEGIDIYLQTMTQLEVDYPDVIFVYMTGHLNGTGPDGNLYQRNNQIREYCAQNGKVLYDFADIESYDPDGNWYPNDSDDCYWCADWCASHDCPSCGSCSHSHCFNCYLKGKALWWMLARSTGWTAPTAVERVNWGTIKARYR